MLLETESTREHELGLIFLGLGEILWLMQELLRDREHVSQVVHLDMATLQGAALALPCPGCVS